VSIESKSAKIERKLKAIEQNNFGFHIKSHRLNKGISMRELSRRTGVSQPYLSQIESQEIKNPSIEIINKIAKELGLPIVESLIKLGYLSKKDIKEYINSNL